MCAVEMIVVLEKYGCSVPKSLYQTGTFIVFGCRINSCRARLFFFCWVSTFGSCSCTEFICESLFVFLTVSVRCCGLFSPQFSWKEKHIYLFFFFIYNASHRSTHQTRGRNLSPLSLYTSTHTYSAAPYNPDSSPPAKDLKGMCHFWSAETVVCTHTHVSHTNLHL